MVAPQRGRDAAGRGASSASLSGVREEKLLFDLQNERTLEFTSQPMENGGRVLLVEDITERTIAQAKINHLARYDSLTGLPNRTVLRDHMLSMLAACRRGQHVRHPLHRSRSVQAGERYARPQPRRHAAGRGRRLSPGR